jgi:hypothetical protein
MGLSKNGGYSLYIIYILLSILVGKNDDESSTKKGILVSHFQRNPVSQEEADGRGR